MKTIGDLKAFIEKHNLPDRMPIGVEMDSSIGIDAPIEGFAVGFGNNYQALSFVVDYETYDARMAAWKASRE